VPLTSLQELTGLIGLKGPGGTKIPQEAGGFSQRGRELGKGFLNPKNHFWSPFGISLGGKSLLNVPGFNVEFGGIWRELSPLKNFTGPSWKPLLWAETINGGGQNIKASCRLRG